MYLAIATSSSQYSKILLSLIIISVFFNILHQLFTDLLEIFRNHYLKRSEDKGTRWFTRTVFLNLYKSPRITIFLTFNRKLTKYIPFIYLHNSVVIFENFTLHSNGERIEKRCIWASSFRDRCRVGVTPTVARILSTRNRIRMRCPNPSRCSVAFWKLQNRRLSWRLVDDASVDSIEKLSLEEAGWSVDWQLGVPLTNWNPEHGDFFFSW